MTDQKAVTDSLRELFLSSEKTRDEVVRRLLKKELIAEANIVKTLLWPEGRNAIIKKAYFTCLKCRHEVTKKKPRQCPHCHATLLTQKTIAETFGLSTMSISRIIRDIQGTGESKAPKTRGKRARAPF